MAFGGDKEHLDHIERTAIAITMAELDGGKFNWKEWEWERQQ